MSSISNFAVRVAANYKTDVGEAAFDPSIILVFAELLIPLIEEIQKCLAARDVKKVAESPTLWQKVTIRLKLRNLLVNNGDMSLKEFRDNADNLIEALRKSASELSVEEVEALYAEV